MRSRCRVRWVLGSWVALASACATTPPQPWIAVAAHAAGDGRSPGTAVRFGPVAGGPLVWVMAELTWLQSHGYSRVENTDARNLWAPAPPRMLHVWTVRDANGHTRSIYFDKTQASATPSVDGRTPVG